ncbi:MAG TPA: MFS transporter [Thermoanaerobaculia bacterium]|nr:MFS transporter [Thermoanaerobaculia bacterium]
MEITQASTAAPEEAPPARLWNRNFFLLWQGAAISQLGNQASSLAMTYWALEKTGSASTIGLLMAVAVLPGVLLAPFGGTFADRSNRVRILVVCDLLSGLGVLLLAGAMLLTESNRTVLTMFFVVAMLGGLIRSFFSPAAAAVMPDLVPRERLAAANSFNYFTAQVSSILGMAAGGVLYKYFGAVRLFVFDGISFLLSGVTEMFIQAPTKAPRREKAQSWRQAAREFLGETREGVRYVWERPGLRNFVGVATSINFFLMPVYVLFPFYVQDYLQAEADWYGFLMGINSAGAVAGFVLASTLKIQGEARTWTLIFNLIAGPLFLGLVGFVTLPALALAFSFVSGAALGMFNIYIMTLLQRSTPSELRGRVIGLLGTLGGAAMPLGMALGGLLGDLTGKNVPLVFGVCTALSVLTTLVLATRKECRLFLRQA